MSTADASPGLERLLESVTRRLPHDALEDLAALRPPFDLSAGDDLASDIARLLQAKAKAALNDEKAGPLPDDFQFNEETWEDRRELESGGGIRHASLEDFLKAHGI